MGSQAPFYLVLFILHLVLPYTTPISGSTGEAILTDELQIEFSMMKRTARTDPDEQRAVYEIMAATGNDWAANIPDICHGRWHGIECNADGDDVYHVVSLSFGAMSDDTAFPVCHPAESYISESITKLRYIRSLFFYRCFVYNPQPLPSFLGQLGASLRTLILRENAHVGFIPNELADLAHLEVLDLHGNYLNGSFPVSFARMMSLRVLDLSENRVEGMIPNLRLPSLAVLDLSNNLLVGSIPSSIGSCYSIIKMDVSHNHLRGAMPNSIGSLKKLTLIDLSHNFLSNPLPRTLRTLTSLQALILGGNPLSIMLVGDEFDGMKSLTTLILSRMNLHGPIPASLGRLTSLRVIYLDENHFNGSIPESLTNLGNLNELKLNDNQLTGRIPFEREMMRRMRRKIELHNNDGLCYDGDGGFEDEQFSRDSGISLCS